MTTAPSIKLTKTIKDISYTLYSDNTVKMSTSKETFTVPISYLTTLGSLACEIVSAQTLRAYMKRPESLTKVLKLSPEYIKTLESLRPRDSA